MGAATSGLRWNAYRGKFLADERWSAYYRSWCGVVKEIHLGY